MKLCNERSLKKAWTQDRGRPHYRCTGWFTYLTSAYTARAYRGRDIKQTVPALEFMIEAVRRKINLVVTAFGLAPERLST